MRLEIPFRHYGIVQMPFNKVPLRSSISKHFDPGHNRWNGRKWRASAETKVASMFGLRFSQCNRKFRLDGPPGAESRRLCKADQAIRARGLNGPTIRAVRGRGGVFNKGLADSAESDCGSRLQGTCHRPHSSANGTNVDNADGRVKFVVFYSLGTWRMAWGANLHDNRAHAAREEIGPTDQFDCK